MWLFGGSLGWERPDSGVPRLLAEGTWLLRGLTILRQLDDCVSFVFVLAHRGSRLAIPWRW